MRHPGSFRPERPPRKSELYATIGALSLLLVGVGLGILYFHDRGFFSTGFSIAAMTFFAAVCVGIVVSLHIERSAQRQVRGRSHEIPPPFDIHFVWPPVSGPSRPTHRKDVSQRPSGQRRSRLWR
ncbi:hypothetical protein VVT58_21910 (plasmid) [Sphingobium sp. SJ10-10]|uniref:hypothetical protein n=1 Tax=Sphingobium sp. SJ10-10 TaxID=3114999 RepID=UPI002E184810|nr:hypothetical protein [Sphingobium sp. SJ10-10]